MLLVRRLLRRLSLILLVLALRRLRRLRRQLTLMVLPLVLRWLLLLRGVRSSAPTGCHLERCRGPFPSS